MKQLIDTHTYKEIFQQPEMWLKEFQLILNERERIYSFISKYIGAYDIVLTGAGTSAFIGNALSVVLKEKGLAHVEAVATTDIITNPTSYFSADKKILLVSFARSGNSPESVGVVNLANRLCHHIAHVFITCNQEGELARMANRENVLLLLLPPETNDISLAMTSSFSTMLLTCLLALGSDHLRTMYPSVKAVSDNARHILDNCTLPLKEIAEKQFDRAVFLGSGAIKGIAEECHLKLQELTDGAVICKFDSFLGFRHGPKAVINDKTLIVYLFSDNDYVQRYERDLVKQINANNHVVGQIAVTCGNALAIEGVRFSLNIVMPHTHELTKEFASLPYVLVGQLLGLFKSNNRGLCPDTPSISGNIARVVEGVTIYE